MRSLGRHDASIIAYSYYVNTKTVPQAQPNHMVPTPIFNMESNNAIYGASCRTATDVSTVLYIGGSIFMQHIMTERNIVGVKKEW